MEPVYDGLDIDKASDHYIISNNNYYNALRNQFSLINTQISKLLYLLVFHMSWLYFLYVYISQIFIVNNVIGQGSVNKIQIFLNTGNANDSSDESFKREQLISFFLISFLVIESKIIESLKSNLHEIGVTNPDIVDTEKCTVNMLAHLDLYISKRQLMEIELSGGKSKDKKTENEKEEITKEIINKKLNDLKSIIDQSSLNPKFMEYLIDEERKRKSNEKIMKSASNNESIDDLPDKYRISLCLNEKTQYIEKIIFFNFIKTKYFYAQVYFAFMYQMQRVGLIFLMTVVTFSPSIPNIFMTVIIFFMELKNKGYADKISILCLIACLFLIKDDILMMMAQLSWMDETKKIAKDYSEDHTLTRFLLNYDRRVIWVSTIFLFFSNFFVLITIGISKIIIVGMNSHNFLKSSIFWYFQAAKSKKGKKPTKVVVDHKKWTSNDSSLLLGLRNLVFIYPLEIYIIIMTLITMTLQKSSTTALAGFIIIPYLISFVNFKEKQDRAKYEQMYFNYYILICWIVLLVLPPLQMNLNKSTTTWNTLNFDIALPLIILINKTYKDFLSMDDYIDNQNKLKNNKILLSSLINYCNTYQYNENKFRENLNIFMKQNHVIECTEKLSNFTDNNSGLDAEIIDDLFKYDEELLPIIYQKSNGWERARIKFFMHFYKFLLHFNYQEIFESVFYLYSTFKRKNRKIINESELNLNQFLKLESDMMIQSINQVESFYNKLRAKDQDKLAMFDDVFKKIEENIKGMEIKERILIDKSLKQKNEEQIYTLTSGSQTEVQINTGLARRPDINYRSAVDSLIEYINQPLKIKQSDDDNFLFNLQKSEDKLVFTNIQPYFVEQTDCFTRFDYMVIFKLIFGVFMSNMEMIIIVIMVSVHLWSGGIYSIIIFTIVFFILIEERTGKFQLWLVLAIIYFFILVCILILELVYTFEIAEGNTNKSKHGLPSATTTELVLLLIGKLESKIGICVIFFMIIFLRIDFEKLGFYNKDILSVENLPMAVHRVVCV